MYALSFRIQTRKRSKTVEITANASKTSSLPKKHLKTPVYSKMVILEPFFTPILYAPSGFRPENASKNGRKHPQTPRGENATKTHENAPQSWWVLPSQRWSFWTLLFTDPFRIQTRKRLENGRKHCKRRKTNASKHLFKTVKVKAKTPRKLTRTHHKAGGFCTSEVFTQKWSFWTLFSPILYAPFRIHSKTPRKRSKALGFKPENASKTVESTANASKNSTQCGGFCASEVFTQKKNTPPSRFTRKRLENGRIRDSNSKTPQKRSKAQQTPRKIRHNGGFLC